MTTPQRTIYTQSSTSQSTEFMNYDPGLMDRLREQQQQRIEELKNKHGIKSRIVSMPSTTIFDQQSRDYKEKVVPDHIPKMIIEAGVTDHWWKYNPDVVLGIDKFGESAPEEDVFEAFGISSRTIVDSVLCLLGNDRNNLRG